MPEEAIIKLVEIIPSLVNSAVLIFIVLLLKKPMVEYILPKIVEFKGLGVEVKLMETKIRNVEAKRAKRIKDTDLKYDLTVLDRVNRNTDVLRNKRVLWIDDEISKIKEEAEVLNEMGINIDISTSDACALNKLKTMNYDLVYSDIERDGNAKSGIDLAAIMEEEGIQTPIIFYISKLEKAKGTPPYAFGITNRFDELLHLTLDCFSRKSTK
ncbi:hypothetical protein [Fusibacter sp. JL216-2]|uniref:hypothetical protein n=1 Tax=Fusibacter sp. JL216-2 TaxID=3071453 RepID=UPI003D3556C8